MEAMKVGIGDIRKSRGLSKSLNWEGELELAGVRLEGPLQLDLKITNAGSRVMVMGPLRSRVRLECSRCSEDLVVPIEVRLEEEFLPAESEEARARAGDLLDGAFTFEDDHLQLDELLRQEIEAAFPIKVLCQPDCRGLCGQCGANLNSGECNCGPEEGDSRWAALQNFTDPKPKK